MTVEVAKAPDALRLSRIRKIFGGVTALDDVAFTVGAGEVPGAEAPGSGWVDCPEAGWYHSRPASTPPMAATISARATSVVLPRERLTSDFH